MKQVTIYTDGACIPNPGNGGWGAILIHNKTGAKKEIYGGESDTTNNRMELMAAIMALETLKEPCIVDLYTDSTYVRNGLKSWIANWKRRNWKTYKKKDVLNADLWKRLDAVRLKHNVQAFWVRGHSGHPENERADRLASIGLQQAELASR